MVRLAGQGGNRVERVNGKGGTSAMQIVHSGLLFDQWNVGQTLQTGGRTITQAHIVSFAGLTGDYNPLHTDNEYCAANTPQGCCIAHGALTFSISVGLVNRYLEGTCIAFVELSARYTQKVLPGDSIRVLLIVKDKRLSSKGDRGVVTLEIQTLNQHGEVVMEGEWKLLMKK